MLALQSLQNRRQRFARSAPKYDGRMITLDDAVVADICPVVPAIRESAFLFLSIPCGKKVDDDLQEH